MEIPRLGVELGLQLPAYTTATATPVRTASVTYTTAHSNNPLSEARDRTHILMDTVMFLTHRATMGTPYLFFLAVELKAQRICDLPNLVWGKIPSMTSCM